MNGATVHARKFAGHKQPSYSIKKCRGRSNNVHSGTGSIVFPYVAAGDVGSAAAAAVASNNASQYRCTVQSHTAATSVRGPHHRSS